MSSKFSNGDQLLTAASFLAPEEQVEEEIDELNDETFGCDLGDINNDWENEHELLAQFTTETSTTTTTTASAAGDNSGIFKTQISPIQSGKNHQKPSVRFEDVFPNCEDIVKKSISNFILDDEDSFAYVYDDDIYPDFASYEGDSERPGSTGGTSGTNQKSRTSSSSSKKKNIDLETLRPPSPSILPFDDPFMSSVWRPLSPELIADDEIPQNTSTSSSHHHHETTNTNSSINADSKIMTLEEFEKNLNLNGENQNNVPEVKLVSKVMRLEDLEAQLLSPPKPAVSAIKPQETYSPQTISIAQNNQLNNMAATLQNHNTSTIQMPIQFLKDKLLHNNKMELAAMSLSQLAISNKNGPSSTVSATPSTTPSIIPTVSPLKVVGPPPGLGANFHHPNLQPPTSRPQLIPQTSSDKSQSSSVPSSSSISTASAPISTNANSPLQAMKPSSDSFHHHHQTQQQQQQQQQHHQILQQLNNLMMSAAFAQLSPQQQQEMVALRAHMIQAQMSGHLAMHHPSLGPRPMVPPNHKMPMSHQPHLPVSGQRSHNFHLDPMVQQEQQRIINKIITPAQAQRSYPAHFMNNFINTRNIDKFAGFMTQKEKEWLVKIFRLQCKVNDPYVEDYYEVNFNLKKSLIEKLQTLAKEKNQIAEDLDIDSFLANQPLIVLPELAKADGDKPKYIQFENALGKIQVLNTKCPRKLLDIDTSSGSKICTYKLDSFSKYLIKIEKLYEYLLNIEDEDKRMPILPEHVKQEHRDKRGELCQTLFSGLMKPKAKSADSECIYFKLIKRSMPTMKQTNLEVDTEIMKVNKGLFLVYRSLFQLNDESQLVVIISSLMVGDNFRRFVIDPEENSKTCYGSTLVKAVARLQQTRSLIYVVANIDDIQVITQNKYGLRLLGTFFNQYKASDDKLLYIYFWKLFVQVLIEQVNDHPELLKLCQEHLNYLSEL